MVIGSILHKYYIFPMTKLKKSSIDISCMHCTVKNWKSATETVAIRRITTTKTRSHTRIYTRRRHIAITCDVVKKEINVYMQHYTEYWLWCVTMLPMAIAITFQQNPIEYFWYDEFAIWLVRHNFGITGICWFYHFNCIK